ncbi:type I glyceraldehyde-3-phosphate dehydrogenase [Candidatus Woesearchaeota archaeon]|nr:type I glyceraldehyde-3-phosphate dehydrogenase [Candidatus Woesearchaeota archaeon]
MVRIAINGFGRIGRLVLKAGIKDKNIDIVGINDLAPIPTLAHLLRYDSVHGPFPGTLQAKEKSIEVNKKNIAVFAEKDPKKLPWKKLGVDIVVESTGIFRTKELASLHLKAGAKKVLLSAPPKGGKIKQIVKGVNEHIIEKDDVIISNASCTTNCFAPIAKVINDNYKINGGVMTTIHAYTADQRIVDGPHKDLRRARSAALSIIPTSTGAAKAVQKVVPELEGKLYAASIRVPVPDGSIVVFVAEIEASPTVEEVNELFKNVSQHHMKGVLEYSDEALVSSDIIGNPHSCIFDSQLTRRVDDNILHVVGWYDNEWGYSCRMIDIAKLMSKK